MFGVCQSARAKELYPWLIPPDALKRNGIKVDFFPVICTRKKNDKSLYPTRMSDWELGMPHSYLRHAC